MKFRIESDGSPVGTRVFDDETGVDISRMIRSVSWTHKAGELPVLTLEIYPADVHLKAVDPKGIETKIVDVSGLQPIGGYREFAAVPAET